MEAEAARCRQLNADWEETIKSVRMLNGFEDFMCPKSITSLRQAARSGPIIILLFNSSSCSALIVMSSNDVQHVQLPEMNLQTVKIYADLPRALIEQNFDIMDFLEARHYGKGSPDQSDLEVRLCGGRENLVNMSPDDIFRNNLADIWKTIVNPVFEVLGLKASCHLSMHHTIFVI
jgi:hypothetical protein